MTFPEGLALAGGRWTITETLRGGPDRGMFRGVSAHGSVLVTMGPPQALSHDELAARFALRVEGVAPLLGVASAGHQGMTYTAIVEAEPAGHPLTAVAPSDRRAVARGLAQVVARSHEAGLVLVGLRPELVYSDGLHCTGVAPRAEPFLALSSQRDYGVPPCFLDAYFSPEVLSLQPPTPASDVFSLCATLVYALEGVTPFGGDTLLDQLSAVMRGAVRPVAIDLIVRAGLSVNPDDRPDAYAIARALAN